VLLWLAGCGSNSGTLPQGQPFDDIAGFSGIPTMQPGADCLSCHSARGLASARAWTVAGTVFPALDAGPNQGVQGVQILIQDSAGKRLTLTSNAAGNFYTAEPLADLVDIEVQNATHRLRMPLSVIGGGSLSQVGSCNRCHLDLPASTGPLLGQQGAPGRLFIPSP
jgi:hypothetical protein